MNMKPVLYQNKLIKVDNAEDLEILINDYLNSFVCDVDELVDIKYKYVNDEWLAFIIYKINND